MVPSGYRQQHARLSAPARLYDSRWRKARLAFLRDRPLCVQCMDGGRVAPATDVDHVIPHRGNRGLFWDEENWQALCDERRIHRRVSPLVGIGDLVQSLVCEWGRVY